MSVSLTWTELLEEAMAELGGEIGRKGGADVDGSGEGAKPSRRISTV